MCRIHSSIRGTHKHILLYYDLSGKKNFRCIIYILLYMFKNESDIVSESVALVQP